jgi:hypothetical protein
VAADLRGHPYVRVLDAGGRTLAVGQLVAYDPVRQEAAILGPLHRPGTHVWTVAAPPGRLWVAAE